MHLPLVVNTVKQVKHPPWSSIRIIGERNTDKGDRDEAAEKYDLLLLDSKSFAVQTISEKRSQKFFNHFDALNSIKDDIVHIFPSNDKKQASIGNRSFLRIIDL